jgi:hypothetical protein
MYLYLQSGKALTIMIYFVMQVALYMISPLADSDKVLCHHVSLGFSAVKDLIMDQYCKDLGLKLALSHTL